MPRSLYEPSMPRSLYELSMPRSLYELSMPRSLYEPSMPRSLYEPSMPRSLYEPSMPQSLYEPSMPRSLYEPSMPRACHFVNSPLFVSTWSSGSQTFCYRYLLTLLVALRLPLTFCHVLAATLNLLFCTTFTYPMYSLTTQYKPSETPL